jgi:hypothetical protein
MSEIFEHYLDLLGVDEQSAVKRMLVPCENALRTAKKEIIGEKVIKKYDLINRIFPENTGFKKVLSEKLQKCGCDYEVFFNKESIYLDLKSLVGEDYDMKNKDYRDGLEHDNQGKKGIALEIYQNGIFTNVNKLTDYFIYTICDKDGIFYYPISYKKVVDICKKYIIHMGVVPVNEYTMYQSNNGTGLYIKYPIIPKKIATYDGKILKTVKCD